MPQYSANACSKAATCGPVDVGVRVDDLGELGEDRVAERLVHRPHVGAHLLATDQWYPDLMGGVARVAAEQARRLARAGHG